MKINIQEGIYRIFVSLSFLGLVFGICYIGSESNQIWQGIIAGIIIGLFIYISYFFLEWIVLGFTNKEDLNNSGAKKFVKNIISKWVNFNYCKPFWFLMIVSTIMLVCLVSDSIKTTNRADAEIENLRQENQKLEDLLSNCSYNFEQLKNGTYWD